MGYWDFNETTGQSYYVEDTPQQDLSGGAQENDPNYLYLQGWQPNEQGPTQQELDEYARQEQATPAWFSAGDVGMGVRRYEQQTGDLLTGEVQYPDPQGNAQGLDPNYLYLLGWQSDTPNPPVDHSLWDVQPNAMNGLPANYLRDKALAIGPWSQSQREYLADIPTEWMNTGAGGMYAWNKIQMNPSFASSDATPAMSHELDHALYYNMLSPKDRLQWTDMYNLAVMQHRMKPIEERGYFSERPDQRAVEAYPTRPKDLPYDMYRFYDPPTTPQNQWGNPRWRKRAFDPSRAK